MRVSFALAIPIALVFSFGSLASEGPKDSLTLNLELRNQEIKEILTAVATASGRHIAIRPGLDGLVSGSLRDSTLDEVLSLLLPQLGADYCDDGHIIRVFPKGAERCVSSPQMLRLPFVGPTPPPLFLLSPFVIGGQPRGAQPGSPPYFGSLDPRMPKTNFMDPRIPDSGVVPPPE